MDSYEEYVRHAERAAYLASDDGAYGGEFAEASEALATAQVHATLAVAHATAYAAQQSKEQP